jgi:hypothetical protein
LTSRPTEVCRLFGDGMLIFAREIYFCFPSSSLLCRRYCGRLLWQVSF